MFVYWDTSALIKRYVSESGSIWVRDTMAEANHKAVISNLTLVELISALNIKLRTEEITSEVLAYTQTHFLQHCRVGVFKLVRPSDILIDHAIDLLKSYSLRAYDSLQLASALYINQKLTMRNLPSLTFISADTRLNQAASQESLNVKNPVEEEIKHR